MTALLELTEMGHALAGLRWVQGAGGNVSIKTDGELWVKASGKRLAEIAAPDGHARVPIDLARRALDGDRTADASLFALRPRPSLEAYFHTIGPRVVAHTHALGVLLHACAIGTEDDDLSTLVRQIPYIRPGRDVGLAVRARLDADAGEQAILLRSHGLIVYAESAARAVMLTEEIDRAARATLPAPEPVEARLEAYLESGERAFAGGVTRRLPDRRTNALQGGPPRYLFPDAVVCASVLFVAELDEGLPLAERALEQVGRAGILVDTRGRRAAFAKTSAQMLHTLEVLAAHDVLEDALGKRGHYLPDDEPAALLNLPSEQYRIRLAASDRS